MPRGIDTEIPRDDRRPVHDAADGKAFGNEPVLDLFQHLGFILGQKLDADQHRTDPLPRRFGQPVLGEDLGLDRIEGAVGHAFDEGRIGHEFGMAFPLQLGPPDGAREMRGIGLRMRRSVAVEQVEKMRPILCPVTVRRRHGFLDRHIDRMARRLERGEGPRVQFVHKGVAKRVVGNARHGNPVGFATR